MSLRHRAIEENKEEPRLPVVGDESALDKLSCAEDSSIPAPLGADFQLEASFLF